MGTIFLILWSLMMLGWYLKSFKTTYGKIDTKKRMETKQKLEVIREEEYGLISMYALVSIVLIFIAIFWLTMATVFTSPIIIVYCILIIMMELSGIKRSGELIRGERELKVSLLSKILHPINTGVIIYFIIFLIERL